MQGWGGGGCFPGVHFSKVLDNSSHDSFGHRDKVNSFLKESLEGARQSCASALPRWMFGTELISVRLITIGVEKLQLISRLQILNFPSLQKCSLNI